MTPIGNPCAPWSLEVDETSSRRVVDHGTTEKPRFCSPAVPFDQPVTLHASYVLRARTDNGSCLCETARGRGQAQGQPLELLEVKGRQCLEPLRAQLGEAEAYEPMIGIVSFTHDKPGTIGPIDQFDNAVMAEQEVIGNFAHCRPTGIGVPANSEEELMLAWCQSRRLCLALAPAFKSSEARSQCQ